MKTRESLRKRRFGLPALAARRAALLGLYALLSINALCGRAVGEATAYTPATQQLVVAKVVLTNSNDMPLPSRPDTVAHKLIRLRPGAPFSDSSLQQSVGALEQSGWFKQVQVESEEAHPWVTLRFRLTPFAIVRDVRCRNTYPLFARDVRAAMSIGPGSCFSEANLESQAKRVRDLYQAEGYSDPVVRVVAHADAQDETYTLMVNIEKGRAYALDRLHVTGNRAISTARLRVATKVWRVGLLPSGGRFVDTQLDADMKALTRLYWKRGYPQAVVTPRVSKTPESGHVRVDIHVEEGPRYDVAFEGNSQVGARRLRRVLTLFTGGDRAGSGVRKSTTAVKTLYRSLGFDEAEVTVRESVERRPSGPDVRRIRFTIREGTRAVVRSVGVSGNQAVDTQAIRKHVLTARSRFLRRRFLVQETLEQDTLAVEDLYREGGYARAVVTPRISRSADGAAVDVVLEISEGPRTRVASLVFRGLTVIGEAEARRALVLKEGAPFRSQLASSDANAVAALISERGYPHVRVNPNVVISADETAAAIVFLVNPGPPVVFGRVCFRGNFRTRDSLLRRELTVKEEKPFSLATVTRGARDIRNMKAFRSVRVRSIGLEEKWEKVDLVVETEERAPFFVELGAGYESGTGAFARGGAGDNNFLGLNKQLWTALEWSEIGGQAEVRLRDPRFLGTRVEADAGLFAERREEFNQTFGTETYGVMAGLRRRWSKKRQYGLNVRYERREQFRREAQQEAEPEDEADAGYGLRNVVVTTPSLAFDSRDSFIRPRKGVLCRTSIDFSQSLTENVADFARPRLDLRAFVTPLRLLTLAAVVRAGIVQPYESEDNIPDDELFYLGGTADVRGFSENLMVFDAAGDPVGGHSTVSGSVETRLEIRPGIELVAFLDAGALGDPADTPAGQEFRTSAGAGLRYLSPIGPLGVVHGWKLNREPGESAGRFHVSIGYTF